jgi:hypothetical protein
MLSAGVESGEEAGEKVTKMAILWFAKDGRRPRSQSGPGMDLSRDDIQSHLPERRVALPRN